MFITAILTSTLTYATLNSNLQDFKARPITLPHISHAVQLVHKDRSKSGGFSAMWLSENCQDMWLVSDYSQVNQQDLNEQPVLKSRWFHTANSFDESGFLNSLKIRHVGQLKDEAGQILSGATESMHWTTEGFVTSRDDSGDLFLYPNKRSNAGISEQYNASLYAVPVVLLEQENKTNGNNGLESITQTSDRKWISIWEKNKLKDPRVSMVIADPSDSNVSINYNAVSSPKEAVTLDNDDVLIIEKDWLGNKGSRLRLVLVDSLALSQITDNQELVGTVLFDQTAKEYDNFEGAATCIRDGVEWLYIVSDDNGDWHTKDVEGKGRKRQRTLLIGFKIQELRAKSQ